MCASLLSLLLGLRERSRRSPQLDRRYGHGYLISGCLFPTLMTKLSGLQTDVLKLYRRSAFVVASLLSFKLKCYCTRALVPTSQVSPIHSNQTTRCTEPIPSLSPIPLSASFKGRRRLQARCDDHRVPATRGSQDRGDVGVGNHQERLGHQGHVGLGCQGAPGLAQARQCPIASAL